jgi:hypothetical protein
MFYLMPIIAYINKNNGLRPFPKVQFWHASRNIKGEHNARALRKEELLYDKDKK